MSASLFALLDDIASLLDDVSVMTKVAAKKTAGVLGDDLALNAQQVSGVRADRELPVVWAVAKGSLLNKLILVPLALLISAQPHLVTLLLMCGGLYLCYEGVEKLAHAWPRGPAGQHSAQQAAHSPLQAPEAQQAERDKVRGAVRTDFVLSAEIIVISLGTVAAAALPQRVAVLSVIALAMTVGVYGVVAGIVKLDDAGLWLAQRASAPAQFAGRWILRAMPWFMRTLSVVGTVAMFLVGGGILVHGIAPWLPWLAQPAAAQPGWSALLGSLASMGLNLCAGLLAGALALAAVGLARRLWRAPAASK